MMRSRKNTSSATVVLIILALLAVPLAAQETRGKKPGLKQASRDFIEDTGRIWSSPLRIKERHVGPLIFLAATTAFLIAADEDIRGAFQSYGNRHAWVGDVGPAFTKMGSLGAAAAAGLFFGAGMLFKDDRARETGYLAACAMAQSFLVEQALKGLAGRRRPFAADGEDHWAGPAGFFKRYDPDYRGLYDSFPSGHSTIAFSLATVVALQYRHTTWVPILAYTVAAGVGLTRVTLDRHWMSDVVVGAVIGHLVARLVVRSHTRRQRLVPVLGCSGRGITLGFHYNLDPVY
jgi:membrane-associated phospholipid phosphatase